MIDPYCTDCRHVGGVNINMGDGIPSLPMTVCTHPDCRTGETSRLLCQGARYDGGPCGPDGLLFEPSLSQSTTKD